MKKYKTLILDTFPTERVKLIALIVEGERRAK
jgi:hypothetical protein